MTFQLVRLALPNTAAILALAVLPAVMLIAPDRRVEMQHQAIETVATSPQAAAEDVVAAAVALTALE